MADKSAAEHFKVDQDEAQFTTDSRAASHPDGDGRDWDDEFEEESDDTTRSHGDAWSSVRWPRGDDESTEYRHLSKLPLATELTATTFELTAQDLELLIKANGFEPKRDSGQIIFGLRGASLVVGTGASATDEFKQIARKTLLLKDVRPNHQHFRCVIGVYDLHSEKLSGFIASTVPCRQAVVGYAQGGDGCNMLPAGCYSYVCGPHKKRDGCLRENEDFNVLRSKRDTIFDLKDNWDLNFPADNIHPAFSNSSAQFSSWGCQTIRGNHNRGDGSFSGEFKDFRGVLGLKPRAGSHGEKFSYVLLTGLEAAIASRLRQTGGSKDEATVTGLLARLRAGSRGERVKALQEQLSMKVDGVFNGVVKKALVERQRKALGWADGVYGPEMDDLLKLYVFKPAPPVQPPVAPVAPPPPQPQPAPSAQPAPPPQQQPEAEPAPQPAPLAPSTPAPQPAPGAQPAPPAQQAPTLPAQQVAATQPTPPAQQQPPPPASSLALPAHSPQPAPPTEHPPPPPAPQVAAAPSMLPAQHTPPPPAVPPIQPASTPPPAPPAQQVAATPPTPPAQQTPAQSVGKPQASAAVLATLQELAQRPSDVASADTRAPPAGATAQAGARPGPQAPPSFIRRIWRSVVGS